MANIVTIQRLLLAVTISLACASCVAPPNWSTPTGKPEVLVSGSDAQGKVVGRMIARNWDIVTQSANAITFERQQLGTANRAIFALGGDTLGIVDGWNISLVPSSNGTRVCLTSTYVKTSQYGKSVNPANQKAGEEFMATLSGL